MPTFTYVARDDTGTQRTGEVVANTESEAASALRSDGKFVVRLQQRKQDADAAGADSLTRTRIRRVDVLYFATQMALMVETGVPVAEALDGIIRQTQAGGLKRVLEDLRRRVEAGEPFSKALAYHPKAFGNLFVNMIRASEMTGRLGPTLSRIAAYMTAQREIVGKIRGAMVYPVALMTIAAGAVMFLMTYVLPKFIVMYQGREALLPAPTKILIALSHWMVAYWPYWTTGTLAAVVGTVLFLRSDRGRPVGHWIMLHAPITGRMYRKALQTRSLQTLGTLIDAGVSVLESVAITRRVVGNCYFERMWADVDADLHRGQQLSAPLYRSTLMPRPIVQMIEAGERSGKVGPVMQRVADYLDVELRAAILSATRLIEPLMICIMGVIVGGIALALLLPIFTISRHIAKF
ncbi:MAG: type II secretion system F family protein [Phycisphaerae bacterium]